MFIEETDFVLESLYLDPSFFYERVGHHQTVVFTILLNRITEETRNLPREITIRVGEVDIDYQRLALGVDTALPCEDFLLRERTRENITGLIWRKDELAFGRGEAL